ncbi:MAG: DNA polymerase III subunit delta', partial [Burkholderiaceae bacterium]|nr:DNA polymerase III subunit delta' [Burkholderiaceae bacterium]
DHDQDPEPASVLDSSGPRTAVTGVSSLPWLVPIITRLLGQRERLPHALLVAGPAGVGKSILAGELARALLCESPMPDGRACRTCLACGWFDQRNHPDFRLLTPDAAEEDLERRERPDKASQDIRISQVRALAEFLAVGGHRGGRRIVVIDPADAMNAPAANSLLKTLEEPGENTVFVLVTSRPDRLAATVRSRCVALPVALPAAEVALEWLVSRTGASRADASAWVAAAAGAPFRALELADPARSTVHRLIVKIGAGYPDISVIQAAEALVAVPARDWLPLLQTWVTDLGRVLAGAVPRGFPEQGEALGRLAASTRLERVTRFDAWLRRQSTLVDHPLNPRLFCEDAMLGYRALFE